MGPPVEGHEPEIGEAGLALENDRFDSAESVGGAARRDGVAVSDEEVRSGERFGLVPRLAD